MKRSIAEGRKLLASLMSGAVRLEHGGRFADASTGAPVVVDCMAFESPLHVAIAAALVSGIELDVRISNTAIVEVCTNIGDDPAAIRAELNKIAPFRWRNARTSTGLGREVAA